MTTPNQALLEAGNRRRTRAAAEVKVPAVVAVLKHLAATGADRRPLLRRRVEAGRLRVAHPDATLAQLADMSDPPLSKNAYAALLRRIATYLD